MQLITAHNHLSHANTILKLNIAVVLSHFELSGVTTNTIDLCEGLVNIGHNVTLIVGQPKEVYQQEKARYIRSRGVSVIEIPDIHRGKINKVRALFSLLKELSFGHYDVIHMESIYLSFIPKLLHKKFTVTLHSWGLKKNIFAPKATRIIAISQGIKEEALNRHGYKEENIDIVLHGVSERFAEPITETKRKELKVRFGIPEGKTVIGIVGSIQPRKGHQFLLKAVGNLETREKDNIHLVFCGNPIGTEDEIWINNEIQKYKLSNKVTIIPHTDPLDVYRCLDILCLPSVWEGFALVTVEAMLAGNCVLRSDVQGAKEQIQNGITGFTFKSQDVDDLREKLQFIISHPDEIKAVALAGKNYALSHFTLNTMAANTAKVFIKTINQ